jgi:hypothetical protein
VQKSGADSLRNPGNSDRKLSPIVRIRGIVLEEVQGFAATGTYQYVPQPIGCPAQNQRSGSVAVRRL